MVPAAVTTQTTTAPSISLRWPFDAHGKPFGGPLPTDRPNTFQGFGSYRQKWFHGESQLGLSQSILQGTPVSTAVPTLGTTSSVQFVEGQGSFVPYTLDSAGNLVAGSIQHGRRTPSYLQTDANFTHYVHVNKEHENRRIGAEINVYNLLNQHAVTGYNEVPITAATAPPAVTSNPTGFDFLTLTSNFDYTGVMNGKKNILASTYNQPKSLPVGPPTPHQDRLPVLIDLDHNQPERGLLRQSPFPFWEFHRNISKSWRIFRPPQNGR